MRALERSGYATNAADGVRSYFEVFGPEDATTTLFFMPTWSLVDSRCWKLQVPYFARRGYRVITFDGRGNGKSERPESGYTADHFASDALAICAAAGVDDMTLVALSAGARPALKLAAGCPDRVNGLILVAPAVRLDGAPRYGLDEFLGTPPDREGWNKYNAVHWREQYDDFVAWFVGEIFSEPHSTKLFDDFVSWSAGTTPEILIATTVESRMPEARECCQTTRCPTLLLHGDDDRIIPIDSSRQLHAAIPNAELVVIEGAGHVPNARDPVRVNLLMHDFLERHGARRQSREVAYARA